MPQTPRFHLDECVTTEVAYGLRKRDRDCTTTQDEALLGASDPDQFDYAKREGRVLITADQDFLAITAEDSNHPGVVFWNTKHHFGQLIKAIDELCTTKTAEDFQGQVFFL